MSNRCESALDGDRRCDKDTGHAMPHECYWDKANNIVTKWGRPGDGRGPWTEPIKKENA